MSLLATSPLLSSLFLTYANRAATLDGPPNPSPIDIEWVDMKTMNDRLQEEVASLQAQLDKETDRAKTAEDCVEALRAQLSSVKRANRDLEAVVSDERTRLEAVTSEYAEYKKEAGNAIAELRITVDKEAVSRIDPPEKRHAPYSTIGCTSCVEPSHRGPANSARPTEGAEREFPPVSHYYQGISNPGITPYQPSKEGT